jgi:hypothetical protein
VRVESRSFWSVGGLVRRAGWLGAHPSAAGRGWWVLWCGWWFLWLGGFCDLGLAGGVQQWLAGLEARCLFDLRWRGNGTGAVVAVGGGWVAALWRWRSWDFFVFVFAAVNLLNALNICSAGELRAEPRAMRLVNHPFRLDSPRLLSYLTSMRVLTLAVTPAISTTFLEHDLFLYRFCHRRKLQLRLCPGETLHRERSGLTTTCGCLFGFVYKKKPTYLERFIREESSQRAPPPPFFLWMYITAHNPL